MIDWQINGIRNLNNEFWEGRTLWVSITDYNLINSIKHASKCMAILHTIVNLPLDRKDGALVINKITRFMLGFGRIKTVSDIKINWVISKKWTAKSAKREYPTNIYWNEENMDINIKLTFKIQCFKS